jgi:hypothetical protein
MSRNSRAGAADLVGVDFARVRTAMRRRRAWLPGLLLGALLAAMGLAQLRMEIFRMRYALGEVDQETRHLREERSQLLARLESLRGPERLTKLARERGFAPPSAVIVLEPSRPGPDARP